MASADQSEALKILTQPQCQGAVNGDKVTFTVVAEGSEYLTYEWLKDGVPISDPTAKARSSTFTIPSFLPAEHKGSYQCIVSSDYDGSVDLAMSKPAELKDLSVELDRARSIQKPLTIVFLGRVGRGKSTLVNSLFGKAVVMEGDSVYPVSQEVLINTYHMSGINVIMIDTPGFMAATETPKSTAETMKEIAEKIPAYDVDLIVYCLKMTDRFDGIDEKIARELTRTYGEKLWTHSLFALTFANEVKPSRNCESLGTITHFKKRLGEMTDAIQKRMLQKSAQVSGAIADNVPVVAVGRPASLRVGSIIDELPDGSNWMSNFWYQVLHRIHEPVKASCNLHPFIKANDHRFLEQTILT